MVLMGNDALCEELEKKVALYLVYLAHAQNSLSMQSGDKGSYFHSAEQIGSELAASMQRLRSYELNEFNKREAEALCAKALRQAMASIDAQLKTLERSILIDKRTYFSLKKAIATLSAATKSKPSFTMDKIERLFSFKHCCGSEQSVPVNGSPVSEDDQLARLKQRAKEEDAKERKALWASRVTAFSSYTRNPANQNPMDYFKAIDLILKRIGDSAVRYTSRGNQAEGVSFIDSPGDEMIVAFKSAELSLEISVLIRKLDGSFQLEIHGFVQGGGDSSLFSINEQIADSNYDTAMRSFRLLSLLEKYNDSYSYSLGSPAQDKGPGEKARGILDSLLDDYDGD